MTTHSHTIPLGAATITIINVGDLVFRLSEVMNVPESEWRPRYAAEFEQPLSFPSQCIHIALPGASILVDAGDYAVAVSLNTPYIPPDYSPPPGLIDQLRERSISPQDITHLLPAVRVLTAPGESPGHQILRVHSDGQTLYCLGDLYHDPLEVKHPTWMARWADVNTALASRLRLVEFALAEDALLVPAHMSPGRLEQTAHGVRWVEA